LIKEFGNLQAIDSSSINELRTLPGIGLAKACQIKAALELGKRFLSEKSQFKGPFRNSAEVASYYIPRMTNVKKEIFKSLLLDSKNKLIREVIISEGSLNYSIVHPREVFNPAIKESAAAVIFIHNHPSGDPSPSADDLEITKRLKKVSDIVGIKLLDHIIIGNNRYFSFVDEQLL
jgi:DNA repair protein RadC